MNTGGCFSTMTVPECLRTLLGIRWLEMGIAAWRWFLYLNFPTIPFLVDHFQTFSNFFTLYLLYLFDLFDFTDLYIVLICVDARLGKSRKQSFFFTILDGLSFVGWNITRSRWSHPMRPAHQRVVDAYRRVEGADDLTWSFLKVREEACLMPNMIWNLPWQIVQKLHNSLYLEI